MPKLAKVIFFALLTAIFFFEGFGIRNGRETAYYIVLFSPLILFAIDFLQKKPIIIPKKMGLLLLVYLGLLFVSTYFSVQVQKSFEQTLFYISVFFIFIYVNNHKDELRKPLFIFILLMGAALLLWTFFLRYVPGNLHFLVPQRDYQYVFTIAGSHIALGSFLIIPLIILAILYISRKRLLYLALFLLFLPFLLLSFAKAAYITLGLFFLFLFIRLFNNSKQRNPYILGGTIILFLTVLLFFFFTTKINLPGQILRSTKTALQRNFFLQERRVLSSRNKLFYDAFQMIREKPMFGVGPGNYIFISKKYLATLGQRNDTSHNIILDVFSEHGIPSGLVFILIIYFLIKNGKKNKDDLTSAYFVTFIFLLVLFLGDYIHRFYSFFVLFLVIAGLIYKEKENYQVNKTLLFGGPIIITVVATQMIASQWFFGHRENKLANRIYPLNKNTYPRLINECKVREEIDCQKKHLETYGQLFKAERAVHLYIGNWYKSQQEYQRALSEFKLAYEWAPLEAGSISSIYELERIVNGQAKAIELINRHFLKLQRLNVPIRYRNYLYIFKEARKLCNKIYFNHCPHKL